MDDATDAWSACKRRFAAMAREVAVVAVVGAVLTGGYALAAQSAVDWMRGAVVTGLLVPAFLLGRRERPYEAPPPRMLLGLPLHLAIEAGLMLGHGAWAYPRYLLGQLVFLFKACLVYRHYCRYRKTMAAAAARAASEAAAAALREQNSLLLAEAYALLGLAPGASQAEVRQAFRRRMRTVHPDKTLHLDPSQRKVTDDAAIRLNTAYDLLSAHLAEPL